eukprot:SM000129S26134  [mRNA]  locus=s129:89353:99031:- [translate_table: standard]
MAAPATVTCAACGQPTYVPSAPARGHKYHCLHCGEIVDPGAPAPRAEAAAYLPADVALRGLALAPVHLGTGSSHDLPVSPTGRPARNPHSPFGGGRGASVRTTGRAEFGSIPPASPPLSGPTSPRPVPYASNGVRPGPTTRVSADEDDYAAGTQGHGHLVSSSAAGALMKPREAGERHEVDRPLTVSNGSPAPSIHQQSRQQQLSGLQGSRHHFPPGQSEGLGQQGKAFMLGSQGLRNGTLPENRHRLGGKDELLANPVSPLKGSRTDVKDPKLLRWRRKTPFLDDASHAEDEEVIDSTAEFARHLPSKDKAGMYKHLGVDNNVAATDSVLPEDLSGLVRPAVEGIDSGIRASSDYVPAAGNLDSGSIQAPPKGLGTAPLEGLTLTDFLLSIEAGEKVSSTAEPSRPAAAAEPAGSKMITSALEALDYTSYPSAPLSPRSPASTRGSPASGGSGLSPLHNGPQKPSSSPKEKLLLSEKGDAAPSAGGQEGIGIAEALTETGAAAAGRTVKSFRDLVEPSSSPKEKLLLSEKGDAAPSAGGQEGIGIAEALTETGAAAAGRTVKSFRDLVEDRTYYGDSYTQAGINVGTASVPLDSIQIAFLNQSTGSLRKLEASAGPKTFVPGYDPSKGVPLDSIIIEYNKLEPKKESRWLEDRFSRKQDARRREPKTRIATGLAAKVHEVQHDGVVSGQASQGRRIAVPLPVLVQGPPEAPLQETVIMSSAAEVAPRSSQSSASSRRSTRDSWTEKTLLPRRSVQFGTSLEDESSGDAPLVDLRRQRKDEVAVVEHVLRQAPDGHGRPDTASHDEDISMGSDVSLDFGKALGLHRDAAGAAGSTSDDSHTTQLFGSSAVGSEHLAAGNRATELAGRGQARTTSAGLDKALGAGREAFVEVTEEETSMQGVKLSHAAEHVKASTSSHLTNNVSGFGSGEVTSCHLEDSRVLPKVDDAGRPRMGNGSAPAVRIAVLDPETSSRVPSSSEHDRGNQSHLTSSSPSSKGSFAASTTSSTELKHSPHCDSGHDQSGQLPSVPLNENYNVGYERSSSQEGASPSSSTAAPSPSIPHALPRRRKQGKVLGLSDQVLRSLLTRRNGVHVGRQEEPIDEDMRCELGKPSRLLRQLLPPQKVSQIMAAELASPINQLPPDAVEVNGKPLTSPELALLVMCDNPPPNLRGGRYWYDSQCGFWGVIGQEPERVITAGLRVGGYIRPECSRGNTGVTLNSREVTQKELEMLKSAKVNCSPGTRLWLDAEGFYSEEGQKASKGNLWDKAAFRSLRPPPIAKRSPEVTTSRSPSHRGSHHSFPMSPEPEHLVDSPPLLPQPSPPRVHRLLLLGHQGAGRSTLVKQAKILYTGGFTREELRMYKDLIHKRAVEYMLKILRAREMFERAEEGGVDSQYATSSHTSRLAEVLLIACRNGAVKLTLEVAQHLQEMWNDQAIQNTMARVHEIEGLSTFAGYFLDRVQELAGPDYEASHRDILYVEGLPQSSGMAEVEFAMVGGSVISGPLVNGPPSVETRYRLIHLGGQDSTGWDTYLETGQEVTGVIFCMSLSSFDETLEEDAGGPGSLDTGGGGLQRGSSVERNKMMTARDAFVSLLKAPSLASKPFILLLTKYDLFEEKIERGVSIRLCSWFSDYSPVETEHTSSQAKAQQAYFYIVRKFKEIDALDDESTSTAFIIIKEVLRWKDDSVLDWALLSDHSNFSSDFDPLQSQDVIIAPSGGLRFAPLPDDYSTNY